jgi:hypothetical protein
MFLPVMLGFGWGYIPAMIFCKPSDRPCAVLQEVMCLLVKAAVLLPPVASWGSSQLCLLRCTPRYTSGLIAPAIWPAVSGKSDPGPGVLKCSSSIEVARTTLLCWSIHGAGMSLYCCQPLAAEKPLCC